MSKSSSEQPRIRLDRLYLNIHALNYHRSLNHNNPIEAEERCSAYMRSVDALDPRLLYDWRDRLFVEHEIAMELEYQQSGVKPPPPPVYRHGCVMQFPLAPKIMPKKALRGDEKMAKVLEQSMNNTKGTAVLDKNNDDDDIELQVSDCEYEEIGDDDNNNRHDVTLVQAADESSRRQELNRHVAVVGGDVCNVDFRRSPAGHVRNELLGVVARHGEPGGALEDSVKQNEEDRGLCVGEQANDAGKASPMIGVHLMDVKGETGSDVSIAA